LFVPRQQHPCLSVAKPNAFRKSISN
jgi:hypothetical protein